MTTSRELADLTKFLIPSFLVRDSCYNPTYTRIGMVIRYATFSDYLYYFKGKWREITGVSESIKNRVIIGFANLPVGRKFNLDSGLWIVQKRKDILDSIASETYWFQKYNGDNIENLLFRDYVYNGQKYNVRAYGKNKDIKNDINYQWQRKLFPGTLSYRQILKNYKNKTNYENRSTKKR